jgi:hypothetical protein
VKEGFMFHRHAGAAIWISAVVSLSLSAATSGQIRKPVRLPNLSERAPCMEEADAARANSSHIPSISFVSYLRSVNGCVADEPAPRHLAAAPRLPAGEQAPPSEPPYSEFQELGHQGFVIARARRQVLDILDEGNSCSAWYAGAEPNPWIKFASLHYQVDGEGEDTAIGDQTLFGLYYREPYVARAQQSVGAGSIITLNAHGAFFVGRAPARVHWNGGPVIQQTNKFLHVALYPGSSVNAQVTTLLHEFGHIVGLLPIDSGYATSAILSTRNTDVVLSHCRKQIEASANRSIMLPESLARLEEVPKRP